MTLSPKRLLLACMTAAPLVAVAVLAGCGGGSPPFRAISDGGALAQAAVDPLSRKGDSTNYRVLHSFGKSGDAISPVAGLIALRGTLYGATPSGGAYNNRANGHDGGTVFSISTTGSERVLYSFGNGVDGACGPSASLVNVNGRLFGTTACGLNTWTLFSITASGKMRLLHSFDSRDAPIASLLFLNGALYGTTFKTVFSMSVAGANYRVLHSFSKARGGPVNAGLIAIKGTLFGTTSNGGAFHAGTVFSLSPSGAKFRILHNFGKGSDGGYPQAALVAANDTLYGTTAFGGAYQVGSGNGGTVFSLSTNGKGYRVLHSFGDGSDGSYPFASLLEVGGTLYGTTYYGGEVNNSGTVFSIDASGAERLLHSFGKGADGIGPHASLIDVEGTLYGTTSGGGANGRSLSNRGGTVFALTP